MSVPDAKAEPFDVFLCHNSSDKPAVREIAQQLTQNDIKAWLDEADIQTGSFWHTAIGQQLETAKAAAVFVGQHGVGPWQIREIIALLDQFDQRGCRVIPVILASAPLELDLPWSLMGIQCVDFRATNSQPLKRLIWAITGAKPTELAHVPDSEKPATMREAIKGHLLPNREDDAATPKWRFGDPQNFKARLYSPLLEPRFAADQFPAVNAFWSLTVYDLPARQLVANSLNRYLINSPMLPSLKSAADGSITLHIQKDTPGKGDEANWLPAPSGSFMLILRTYWLKAAVLDGRWTTPPVQRVN